MKMKNINRNDKNILSLKNPHKTSLRGGLFDANFPTFLPVMLLI